MHAVRVPPDVLEPLKAALLRMGGALQRTTNPYEAFRLEVGRFPVVAYTSGKMTVSDARVIPILEEVLTNLLPSASAPVVGSDETGKGEWLGPLVVAACAVLPRERARLVARGVMDSKDLARGAIGTVAAQLASTQLHQVLLVAPPKFNELWPRFKAEGKNLNDLLAWAHAQALADVLGRLEASGKAAGTRIVVDEFARVATQARTARAFDVAKYPVEQRVRAEDEVAVAAASILAKDARERWIDAYERKAQVPVRSLTREKARAHPKAGEFAKVGFL